MQCRATRRAGFCATALAVFSALPAMSAGVTNQTTAPASPAVWTLSIGQSNSSFGFSAAAAGDVNGDGFADVIVGAPKFTHTLKEEGAAFVYYGSASGLPAQPDWAAYGGQSYADFGFSVVKAGDVNRDGFDDVLIGASAYTFRSGEYNVGAALIFLGSSNGLSATPAWVGQGPHSQSHFGYSVAGVGDINGDGYPDLIVGAPTFRETGPPVGKVFVWYGSPHGYAVTADWTFTGDQPRARFGHPVAGAGDVNHDGFADVIIAARDYDVDGVDNAGKVWVFHGSRSGLGGRADWTFAGRQRFGRVGFSGATAGDVNHDGFDDVIIGAGGESHGEEKEGAAYAFLGSAKGLGAADWFVESNQGGAGLGQGVGQAGDVNGDGFADVILGAPGYNGTYADEGRAFVFHGSRFGLRTNAAWAGRFSHPRLFLGRTVTTAGDVNRDGFDEALVCGPMDSAAAPGGVVRVYTRSPNGLPPFDADPDSHPIVAFRLTPPTPPLWAQSWFWGVGGLMLVGLSAIGWHLVTTTRLKRQLRRSEQARLLEQERLRIAQDLHDHLGSNLATITLLSEVARRDLRVPDKADAHLNHISGTARDLTRALEEIVWAVNPRKNKLDQLVAYFSAYAEEFLRTTELRCRLDFPDELPELVVASEIRHELFLVFKEALTNIVRHAAASEVRVRLTVTGLRLALTIEDDGLGFESSSVRPARNGLANMRSRVEKLGGQCHIHSEPGKGTRVHVEVGLALATSKP